MHECRATTSVQQNTVKSTGMSCGGGRARSREASRDKRGGRVQGGIKGQDLGGAQGSIKGQEEQKGA